jgi:hypothetical protein
MYGTTMVVDLLNLQLEQAYGVIFCLQAGKELPADNMEYADMGQRRHTTCQSILYKLYKSFIFQKIHDTVSMMVVILCWQHLVVGTCNQQTGAHWTDQAFGTFLLPKYPKRGSVYIIIGSTSVLYKIFTGSVFRACDIT